MNVVRRSDQDAPGSEKTNITTAVPLRSPTAHGGSAPGSPCTLNGVSLAPFDCTRVVEYILPGSFRPFKGPS